MPFKDSRLSLRDISDAIDLIVEFTRDMDFEAFRSDPKTLAAVERKLSVISEAAVRLGDQAPTVGPDVPWHKIRGTGNWLRHQYDRVDPEIIWRTVIEDLPPLKSAVAKALAMPPPDMK